MPRAYQTKIQSRPPPSTAPRANSTTITRANISPSAPPPRPSIPDPHHHHARRSTIRSPAQSTNCQSYHLATINSSRISTSAGSQSRNSRWWTDSLLPATH
ncbi:hypothetical protein M758_3G056100 [Ceratodon purpureus]|uniref:Uncharacterized protein n=1 Tax=Ceratodon purpureus TaxID=3225 RepID=A0A8T0IHL1_CERPU|nr:hypothetical protein KC19_3G057000 [Ceratodon purpureus]KAG0621887.1 hypothetical protein M758_3G056100 [Ceratodon purpureus]